MNIESLIRPEVISMEPYAPIVPFEVLSARLGRQPADIVKLDANENPYGPSPQVQEALANLPFAHIYPDPASTVLRKALAEHLALPVENILAGAGADELIDLVLRLFVRPGDSVLDCPPTFGMYEFDTAVNAGRLIKISRRADFSVDVGALEALLAGLPGNWGGERLSEAGGAIPKVLFIASPNNPDGSLIADEALSRLLALPLVIVLDEAYVEFSGTPGHAAWVPAHDNLIVLRTFSKCAGLAGLRVGYGIFPPGIMPHLWKIKQPYNVSVAAAAAAMAALGDVGYMNATVTKLVRERERMAKTLNELPFLKVYPSKANFILCRVVGRDARALKLALEQQGILVRHFNKPGLTDCIRISAGTAEQTTALLNALGSL